MDFGCADCLMLGHADAPERERESIASRAQHGVRGRVASGLHGEQLRCMASSQLWTPNLTGNRPAPLGAMQTL